MKITHKRRVVYCLICRRIYELTKSHLFQCTATPECCAERDNLKPVRHLFNRHTTRQNLRANLDLGALIESLLGSFSSNFPIGTPNEVRNFRYMCAFCSGVDTHKDDCASVCRVEKTGGDALG